MARQRGNKITRPLRMTQEEADLWMANAIYRKANFSDYARRLLDDDAKRIARERKVMDRIVVSTMGSDPGNVRLVQAIVNLGKETVESLESCCGSIEPQHELLRCVLRRGHLGVHEGRGGVRWP